MAEETEKVLTVKINYDGAIRKIAEYKTKLDEVREREKALKKELEKGQISREEYNLELAKSKAEAKSYSEVVSTTTNQVSKQLKADREYGSYLKMGTALLDERVDSINKAIEVNKGLREAVRNITDAEDADHSIRQKLNAAIDDNTAYIKRNSDSYIQQKMTIGDYREEVKAALVQLKNGGFTIQSCGIVAQQFADVLKVQLAAGWASAAAGGMSFVKALKLVKVALAATGIGAVLILLTSLAAMFTKTQAGVEMFSKVTSSAGAIVSVFVDRLSALGTSVVKLFKGDFKGAAEEAKAAVSGLGKEIVEETKLTWKLKDALNQLEKQEVMLNMKRAAGREKIEELKRAAEDVTLSMNERLKASEKAFNMEMQLGKESIEIGKKKLANMLGQITLTKEAEETINGMASGAMSADEAISKLGLSNSTIDDLKEFQQLFEQVAQAGADMQSRSKESQNKANEIRNAVAEKGREMRAKELDEIRKAEDELLKLVKDTRERCTIEVEREYNRQIEDLKIKLRTEKDLTVKAREAIRTQITALEKQKEEALELLSEQSIQKEIQNKQELISLQLEAVEKGSDKEYQLKMQMLISQRDAELRNKELSEQMKEAITEKYNKKMDELSSEQENARLEARKRVIDLELMYEEEGSARKLELLLERLNIEKAEEINNTVKTEEEKEKIKKLYQTKEVDLKRLQEAEKKRLIIAAQQDEYERLERHGASKYQLEAYQAYQEIELLRLTGAETEEIVNAKLELTEKLIGQQVEATAALGEESKGFAKLSKILALAQVAIETGRAISIGISSAMHVPFPGNIAAVASTIATVMANIATAKKTIQSAKFAHGGLVQGPGTGTSDSIPAQLSNGESVLTANATSMFAPMLSAFNQMGGGVPISVSKSSNEQVGKEMLAEAFSMSLEKLPNPVVSVQEIRTVGKKVEVLENMGSI